MNVETMLCNSWGCTNSDFLLVNHKNLANFGSQQKTALCKEFWSPMCMARCGDCEMTYWKGTINRFRLMAGLHLRAVRLHFFREKLPHYWSKEKWSNSIWAIWCNDWKMIFKRVLHFYDVIFSQSIEAKRCDNSARKWRPGN